MTTDTLQTPYGIFSGISARDYYPGGKLRGIRLEEQNIILTHAGELIPFFGDDSPRRKYRSTVTFHTNGMIKAVELEAQQEVLTPIGELPAELITFYDSGEVKRVFPLNGKISGFWSEEDERTLHIPLRFEFDFTSFTAMISSICFFKSGSIKSVTLFPEEQLVIKHALLGEIRARHGFSLFEDGRLQSFEPAAAISLKTPIGTISAYDCGACGINADCSSLRFDKQGRIAGFVCSDNRIFVNSKMNGMFSLEAKEITGDADECSSTMIPLKIDFDYEERAVVITDYLRKPMCFSFDDDFVIYQGGITGCTSADCASCKLCGNK